MSKYDDAAVSRLVEAAKAAVTKWLQAGIVSAMDMSTLQAAVANALPAPGAEQAEPAKGEHMAPDGGVGNDPLYIKPAPPAMPPDGTRWKAFESGYYYEFRNGVVRYGNSARGYADFENSQICTIPWLDENRGPRIPPTPTPAAMETAEAVAERCLVVPVKISEHDDALVAEIECNIVKETLARDSAWQAKCDEAGKAGAGAGMAISGDAMDRVKRLETTITAKDAEIARLDGERKKWESKAGRLTRSVMDLESRLSAAGGVDRELLDVASRVLAGIITKIPLSVVTDIHNDVPSAEKWSYERGMRVRDGAVAMAVSYAKALHTAMEGDSR